MLAGCLLHRLVDDVVRLVLHDSFAFAGGVTRVAGDAALVATRWMKVTPVMAPLPVAGLALTSCSGMLPALAGKPQPASP